MIRLRYPVEEVKQITVYFNQYYLFGLHKGLDFKTKCDKYPSGVGTPIRAAASGEWKESRYYKGIGNYIVLKHKEGYETLYGHLSKSYYKEGYKTVKAGDIIGEGGNTGIYTTGSHLHFELRKDGIKIDPLKAIEDGNKLKDWARARALMRVDSKGEILLIVKDKIIPINKDNCWDIISQNTWGIGSDDFNDLQDLIR